MEPLEWSESRTDQLSGTPILGAPLPVTRPRQCETREMQKRSRRITDVANAISGLRWCIGGQDIRRGPQSRGIESSYAWSVAPARAPESNIEIIFADWLDAMRRGDLETMAGRLLPAAVPPGGETERACRQPAEV